MAKQQSEETIIKKMLEGVPAENMREARQLAENILFMEGKLSDAREEIGDASLVIEYSNGGGQYGLQRNPLVAGYESLIRTYAQTVKQLETMKKADKDSLFDWNK